MEAIEAIFTRRSTRNFKPDTVEPEKLEKIIEAGRRAPCGGNTQTNHFIVVRAPEMIRRLTEMAERASPGWRPGKTPTQA